MNHELLQRIDQEIENSRDALAQDTIKLIRINSVQADPLPGAPFGKGPKEVLDTVLEMGQEVGFHPTDYNVGVVSLSLKEGQPDLGIWLHGDVVPVGDGWIYPPFEGTQYKGCVIGRGATDNKGQLAAIFHLLKMFKNMGIQLRYNPALYVGSNEETGMEDLKAFLSQHTPPKLSLVPDSSFPVGYGGKGGMNIWFRSKRPLHDLTITAGAAETPGRAEAILCGKTFFAESPPRHAANPNPNGNMITRLMEQLLEEAAVAPEDRPVLQFFKDISLDINGKQFGIYIPSQVMRPLTVCAMSIVTQEGHPCLKVNIRYPVENTAEQIIEKYTQVAEQCGLELSKTKIGIKPYLLDPNQPVIQKLNAIANEITGSDEAPYTLGGGTYAHCLPNALAYGMSGNQIPKDFPAGHGGSHGKDEVVSLDRLQRAMKIYARALLALNEMDW